jgi:hypothetical protein
LERWLSGWLDDAERTRVKEPVIEIGDVVVSKFGNRWRVEAREQLTSGEWAYVLRNKPEEAPDANGTVVSGMLPVWANEVRRNHAIVWMRPTPQCKCPTYANANGPYPSGFCRECGEWYPGKAADAVDPQVTDTGKPTTRV